LKTQFVMRFEIISAWILGALLPLLETGRRGFGYWRVSFTSMFEDYLAGALLLFAGWLALRRSAVAPIFLVLAWAYCTGMMGSSFWGHVEATLRGAETECYNSAVVIFKLAIWSTCATSLALSVRQAARAVRI
jgi:hypothetical protein